jgi:predicted neutral ceramidase superfamily lipid hydrolase
MAPKRDLTKYSSYFTLEIPSSINQIALIILIGAIAGSVSSLFVHYKGGSNVIDIVLLGASSGILVVSLPALLTVMTMRIIKRKVKTKHLLFAALAVSGAYSAFIITDSMLFSVDHNGPLAYAILLLANASIYGYWFIINRVAIGQKRSAAITAEIQPILNVLMYFPFGGYLLKADFPIDIALVKLYSGILVFLVMGYAILYLLDRPAKKKLSVSSIDLFSNMVDQWLYDIATDANILGSGGIRRDVDIDVAVLYGKKSMKAVFVRPDIHYGPFGTVGGSAFPETLGSMITSKYNSAPFIIHGAVNIEDNPMNTNQVFAMSKRICSYVDSMSSGKAKSAQGSIGFGRDDPCRAINIKVNDLNLLTLTKAPMITEDIDRNVGMRLSKLAGRNGAFTILIDAHNSRFESASPEELKGIGKLSRYIPKYERAIIRATEKRKAGRLRFGASYMKITNLLHNPDLGRGYSSVGIFEFGRRKFVMIYIDANNMLPGFRNAVISHIKYKYRVASEIYTTDTHSVNSLAMSASNSLGRHTSPSDIIPVLDRMVEKAINDIEPVGLAHGSTVFRNFKVWGTGSEELLNKVGMEIIKVGKRVVPLVIVGAYIVAGWIIYVI